MKCSAYKTNKIFIILHYFIRFFYIISRYRISPLIVYYDLKPKKPFKKKNKPSLKIYNARRKKHNLMGDLLQIFLKRIPAFKTDRFSISRST